MNKQISNETLRFLIENEFIYPSYNQVISYNSIIPDLQEWRYVPENLELFKEEIKLLEGFICAKFQQIVKNQSLILVFCKFQRHDEEFELNFEFIFRELDSLQITKFEWKS